MKPNRTFLMLAVLSLLLAAPVAAQRTDSLRAEQMRATRAERMERAQQMRIATATERLDHRLALTDEQETEIRRLLQEHRDANATARTDESARSLLGAAIADVLTDEQRSRLLADVLSAQMLAAPGFRGDRRSTIRRIETQRRMDRRHRAFHRLERQRHWRRAR